MPLPHSSAEADNNGSSGTSYSKTTWLSSVVLVVAACLLSYHNCLFCSFVFDDVSAVKDNRDLRPTTPWSNVFLNDFWGTPMSKEHSHKSYRPVTVITFRLNYWLHELAPLGYHLGNLVLHCAVCVLYRVTLLRLRLAPPGVATAAAVLFAVHPIHTEAVTGVVGRAELISSLFFLMALILYRRRSSWSHAVCVALAMLSKEQGITVLGVALVYELLVIQRLQWPNLLRVRSVERLTWKLGALVATGSALLLLRFYVMGSTLPVFTPFDNPASYEEFPTRQLTWAYLVAVNLGLLLSPSVLCCDWTMGTVPLVKSVGDPRNLATLLSVAVLAHLGLFALFNNSHLHLRPGRSRRRPKLENAVALGLAILALPFLPASNLFFPVGFVVAERILYLPSMGFCLLVAHGYRKLKLHLSPSPRRLLKFLLLSLALLHGAKTCLRNYDWRDELSIFLSGLKVNAGNAKLFNNVGHALEAQEKFVEALRYFERAASVQSDDIGAHINVGRTLSNLGRDAEAEEAYVRAKALLPHARRPGDRYTARVAPHHLSVFLNLANLISKDPARLEEADALFRQAITMRSDYVQAYINRGDVLIRLNRTDEARSVYERALDFEPDNPDLHYNLGVVFIELGQPRKALDAFDRALRIEPEHLQALMNSAILIQETGDAGLRPVAYQRLFTALRKTPESERVHFNLGMLAMDDADYDDAEKWFRVAVGIKADFRSALFNLALLLNERKRPLEAVPFLQSLLTAFPDHVKGLVLLGDIYTNHVRDLDSAERCYRQIIRIEPGHVQAQHNLCVVMVERGELEEAERCLREVQALAPELNYVGRHLGIVEGRIKAAKETAAEEVAQNGL